MVAVHVALALLNLALLVVVVGGVLFGITYAVMAVWYTLKGEKW